jgi:predicted sugar kinase
MADFVSHLRDKGIRGVGQTSWGPTIFALCRSQDEAEQMAQDLKASERWPECEFLVSAARNTGAEVLIESEQ